MPALVHGCGNERIASLGCSDRTIRRRVHVWAEADLMPHLHNPGPGSIRPTDWAGSAPCLRRRLHHQTPWRWGARRTFSRGSWQTGPQTLPGEVAAGIPLHLVAAGANQPDSTQLRQTLAGLNRLSLLPPELPTLQDRMYTGARVQAVLAESGCVGVIPPVGGPAPGHVGDRWVKRTCGWLNDLGRLRRCPERSTAVVDLYLFQAASIVVIQHLLRAAVQTFLWLTRSTTRRLR